MEKTIVNCEYAFSSIAFKTRFYFEAFKHLEPSNRGEYELTDIINIALENAPQLVAWVVYHDFWIDAGTFQGIYDLTKKMAVIQKGTKPIDGRTWEVYVRALDEFPAYILNAVRQKGIRIEPYRCGLEIGLARVIDRFSRIYISYIEGSNNCSELPQNDSLLNDKQLQMIRRFADQYDKNVTISDQSDG